MHLCPCRARHKEAWGISRSWLLLGQGLSWVPWHLLAWVAEEVVHAHREFAPSLVCPSRIACTGPKIDHTHTHIFLNKIDKVLKVNIIPVGFDIAVDEEIDLVSNPVLEDKGQDPCRQLQEEDEAEEHRKLGWGSIQMVGIGEAGLWGLHRQELPTRSARPKGAVLSSSEDHIWVLSPPGPAAWNPEPCVC